MVLENKKFIVGVTGGIAAYKSCELVSKLVKSGAEVRVVMTHSALKFVSPVTFSALTGNPVSFDMFNSKENIPHIELVSDADLLAVIPATANIIGKLANGIADDLLSTMLLAANCPVFMAPAMNINMYNHPSVQSNIRELIRMGIHIIEPEEGHLACGTTGKGRLPSPESLFREIKSYFVKETDLKGFRVLITAGGTKEPIDPVRYIGNHSSGKMGYALARTAKNRGAKVTLISTVDKEIAVDQFIKVKTAYEMYKHVTEAAPTQDIIVMAAAVADYMPVEKKQQKIKKSEETLVITLKKTPDILAELGQNKGDKILVGFAAETHDVEQNAMKKISEKNLDLIIANDVSNPKIGFSSDNNQVNIYDKNGLIYKSKCLPKNDIADIIWDTVLNTKVFKNKRVEKGVENHG